MNKPINRPSDRRSGGKGTAGGGAVGSVRVIGGRWRGSRLPVSEAPGLRPTSDRVRETLFNWLGQRLHGARCLDLFAGSGALGIEAASRGAAAVLLVERDAALAAGLRDTVQRLRADNVTVRHGDALALPAASELGGPFDIAFVDPPFDAGLWQPVLARLPAVLAAAADIYIESPVDAVPQVPADWLLHRAGTTREVRFALYRRGAGAAA